MMKHTKKALLLLLIAVLVWMFCACDPNVYYYSMDQLQYSTVSVELIHYDNPSQKELSKLTFNQSSKMKPFDFTQMEVLETLDEDKLPPILEDISTWAAFSFFDYDSANGICIKINYRNEQFDIITCDYEGKTYKGFVGRYDKHGKQVDFLGSFDDYEVFTEVVNRHFDTKI